MQSPTLEQRSLEGLGPQESERLLLNGFIPWQVGFGPVYSIQLG